MVVCGVLCFVFWRMLCGWCAAESRLCGVWFCNMQPWFCALPVCLVGYCAVCVVGPVDVSSLWAMWGWGTNICVLVVCKLSLLSCVCFLAGRLFCVVWVGAHFLQAPVFLRKYVHMCVHLAWILVQVLCFVCLDCLGVLLGVLNGREHVGCMVCLCQLSAYL